MLGEACLCRQEVTIHMELDQETGSVWGPEVLIQILQLPAYLQGCRVQVYGLCTAQKFLI